ncbi:membrane protein [Escherichia coli LAU-EC8]|nr:membrane protein [Escherichia coli LAU-EC8]ETE36124.1 membrane protein [Escherichia coli LAU-EC9]
MFPGKLQIPRRQTMTEIQRLLTETIESLNTREKRDNKPRFSISFIRKHPGLFIGMYVAFFATLAVMLQSETLSGSVWLLVVLFILLNGFFFFDVYPRYRYEDIDVLDFRVCYNGEWYNTRFVPAALVEAILNSPRVADVHKEQLQKMLVRKGELSFYDIFTLARAESTS